MRITETLYITNRDDWRAWLKKNQEAKKEIWLIYYKKHTGKRRIPYDDAVEEALCFGWIDSTVQRIDDERYAQKFTPRRKKSRWSELNIRRAKKMIRAGKMTGAGSARFNEMKNNEKELRDKRSKKLVIPLAFKRALAKNKKALGNFENFAAGYRRMYIEWIAAAKKDETREKRIKQVIEWAARNRKPGML